MSEEPSEMEVGEAGPLALLATLPKTPDGGVILSPAMQALLIQAMTPKQDKSEKDPAQLRAPADELTSPTSSRGSSHNHARRRLDGEGEFHTEFITSLLRETYPTAWRNQDEPVGRSKQDITV